MSTSRERILARLRANSGVTSRFANPRQEGETEWQAKQPPIDEPVERFMREQAAVGGEVRLVQGWEALPETIAAWLGELDVRTVMLGMAGLLAPVREHLERGGRFDVRSYDRPVEEQRAEIFATDCGITTSRAAIAETGSVVLVPDAEEPRLLSLALPVHLVVVERARMFDTLSAFIASGEYQREVPTNLVVVSGASRTADIELTLTVGVHGPKRFCVALVE